MTYHRVMMTVSEIGVDTAIWHDAVIAMRSWTPLWSMIVDSSIWTEPDSVRIVFVTMLALKDSDDVCRMTPYQLARRANKSEQEVLDALRVLSSPDSRRIEHQEDEGRRIRAVEDGWLILGGAKYRELVQVEMRQARWRRAQAAKRRKARAALAPAAAPAGAAQFERDYEEGRVDGDGVPFPTPVHPTMAPPELTPTSVVEPVIDSAFDTDTSVP